MRLDTYMAEHEMTQSRNKANELIKSGLVRVNNKVVKKASYSLSEEDVVSVSENKQYVSRAGYKLKEFLLFLGIDIENKSALDIGSSTGGFVEVLLEHGVSSINAVDVGSEQLHESLRSDRRITLHENTDIREFTTDKMFDVVTCDVSFIPTTMILEQIDRLANDEIIILFKPQFEVGRNVKRDKRGKVTDSKSIDKAIEEFIYMSEQHKWKLITWKNSTLAGKEGNIERLFYFRKK